MAQVDKHGMQGASLGLMYAIGKNFSNRSQMNPSQSSLHKTKEQGQNTSGNALVRRAGESEVIS